MGSVSGNSQSKHLKPIMDTDDPRYKNLAEKRDAYNAWQKKNKERRMTYADQLKEFKADQIQTAKFYMDNGLPNPAELLMNMIQSQLMVLADPKMPKSAVNKEQTLLLQMYDRYEKLTGAAAANSSTIDINVTKEDSRSPEDIQKALLEATENMRVINNGD